MADVILDEAGDEGTTGEEPPYLLKKGLMIRAYESLVSLKAG